MDPVFWGHVIARSRAGARAAGVAAARLHEVFAGAPPDTHLARSRTLEELRSEASFTAGVVLVGEVGNEQAALISVAVAPDSFVLLREGMSGLGEQPLVQVGWIPRELSRIEVTGADGSPIPEAAPTGEGFEPDEVACVLVAWRTENGGDERQQAFLFRARSAAWDVANRFRRHAEVG